MKTAIRASAGSGKTYELTTRYLRLMRRHALPEHVLATTFTRKAAGEILGRVLSRLAGAATDPVRCSDLAASLDEPEFDQTAAVRQLVEVCHSLHRVTICTLDSFFSRLFRSYRHDLGWPTIGTLLEPESRQAVRIRTEALRLVLADERPQDMLALLDGLRSGLASRAVAKDIDELVVALHDVYRQAPEEAWSRLIVPPPPSDDAIEEAVAALREQAAAAVHASVRKGLAKAADVAEVGGWQALLDGGPVQKVLDGESTYYGKPLGEGVVAAGLVLIEAARHSILGDVAARTSAMADLLRRFDAHYDSLRRRSGALLFSDVPIALARDLPDRDADEIAYRLDSAVEHLLLDEFQDTNREQWAVLRSFVDRVAGAGADSVNEGTLFFVGDAKQAIYGWRGGCAEIFDQLETDVAGLDWESREESFRSSQVVLDVVNSVFGGIERCSVLTDWDEALSGWRRMYRPHRARRDLPGWVELTTTSAAPDSEPEPGGDGSDGVETPVSRHFRDAAELIAAQSLARPRASIGVLTRSNDAVRRMIYLLGQKGIEVSGEGGSPVTDDPAVEVILSALTMADHPGDSASAFHVLNSPLAPELRMRSTDGREVARLSSRIRSMLLTDGYAETLGRWARALAGSCDPRGARRLSQLVELADSYAPEATLRPTDFVLHVRASHVEEPSPARVRVLTIHRAKGLEFDIVVLPELHKKMVGEPTVLIDRPEPTGPIRAVYARADAQARRMAPELEAVYQKQRNRDLMESLCVLYVAMTRARHALHMVVPPLQMKKDGTAKSLGLSPAALLRATLPKEGGPETFAGREVLYSHGSLGWTLPEPVAGPIESGVGIDSGVPSTMCGPVRAVAIPATARRARRDLVPSSLEQGGRVRGRDLLVLDDVGRQLGTVFHAWFAVIGWADEGWPDDRALVTAARAAAPTVAESRVVEWIPQFREALRTSGVATALARPTCADTDLWRERPFAVRLDDALVHGVFDRVVVEREEGHVVRATVIDFKTDAVGPQQVDGRAESYGRQIGAYRRAAAALLGLPTSAVKGMLVFVRAGATVIVEGD